MSAGSPLVSIVLFCRNCDKTLETALESVVSQKADIELLVLDGGSDDGSVEIIRRYEQLIDFWRSHPDGSSTNAINEGVQRARGAVIGLLAGDDWYEPGSLRRVVDAFAADPALTVLSCGTRFAYYDDSGKFIRETRFLTDATLTFNLANVFRTPLTCGRFIKREAFLRFGGFEAGYKTADDLDFFVRLCLSNPRTAINTALTYSYRAHSGSRTLRGGRDSVVAMAGDNSHIARKYAALPDISEHERTTLTNLDAEYSALATWNALRLGRFSQAAAFAGGACRARAVWPFYFFGWLLSQAMAKMGVRRSQP